MVKGVEDGREIEMAKARYLLMGDSICEMVMKWKQCGLCGAIFSVVRLEGVK